MPTLRHKESTVDWHSPSEKKPVRGRICECLALQRQRLSARATNDRNTPPRQGLTNLQLPTSSAIQKKHIHSSG